MRPAPVDHRNHAPRRVRAEHCCLSALLVAACGCPIPIPRDTVTRKAFEFVVRDRAGAPIADARVMLLTGTDPHNRVETIDETTTDAEGRAALTEQSEIITTYPLVMHGVAFYYWSWCIEAPGKGATTKAAPREGDAGPLEVVLDDETRGHTCVERHGEMRADRVAPTSGLRWTYGPATTDYGLDALARSTRENLGRFTQSNPDLAFTVRVVGDGLEVDIAGVSGDALAKIREAIEFGGRLERRGETTFGP